MELQNEKGQVMESNARYRTELEKKLKTRLNLKGYRSRMVQNYCI